MKTWQEMFPECVTASGKQIKRTLSTEKKTEIYIYRFKELHGNTYSYELFEYLRPKHKGIIICQRHGQFRQTADKHLQGKGCPSCGTNSNTREEFISKAIDYHGNVYLYDNVEHDVGSRTKVPITCRIHGDFMQAAGKHLLGQGCPECSRSNQDTLYILTDGKYKKIGITNNLPARVRHLSWVYNTKLTVVESYIGEDVKAREKDLLSKYTYNPYADRTDLEGYTEWRDFNGSIKKTMGT